MLDPVLSFTISRRSTRDQKDSSGSASRYSELGDDAVGVLQVAPPDVDDLPAELRGASLAPGVAVLRRRRGVPLPALALDADLAGRVGEVELGEQDAALVAHRVLVDETDAGASPRTRLGEPLEPAPRQALVDPLAEQHQQRRRTGPAARAATPSATRAQLVGVDAAPQRAVERPRGPADADDRRQQGERGGDRRASGSRRRRTTWASIAPRVRWTATPRRWCGLAPLTPSTSTVSWRSKPSRPCSRAAAPWEMAVTPRVERGGHRPACGT